MQLRAQPTSVDFASYRATLGNQAIVDEIESHVHAFKPKTYDVGRQIKAIETFEVQAVQSAQETKAKVDAEVADLTKALKDISETRPWDQITVVGRVRASATDDANRDRRKLCRRVRMWKSGWNGWCRSIDGWCQATRWVSG